jgi:hypothetical protein
VIGVIGKVNRKKATEENYNLDDQYIYFDEKGEPKEFLMGNNTKDNVDSPSHYNQAGIECIDAIKASLGDGYQDYCKGNVMKYLWRYKYKNGIEDLKKAQWYLNSMVDSLQEQEGN